VLTGPLSALSPALTGAAMGLQFDPLTAAVSAAVSAALVGYPTARVSRRWAAAGVLAAGWAVGDGIRIAASVGTGGAALVYGTVWAVTGFGIGYLAPTLAGATVGRSVFRGTGWLAAAAVAQTLTPAVWALSGRVSLALWAVAR
jgi:hypothetical protein